MGRNRKCNWKRKQQKAEKKLNKNKPISGFDYYKLSFDPRNHNEKFWDEMYKQYADVGTNIIITKSRRGGNLDLAMKMAEEFYKRSPLVFAPAKPNENLKGLTGRSFDYIDKYFEGRDPDLPYFRTPKEKEDFDLLLESVRPKIDPNFRVPIILGTAGELKYDSERFSSYQLLDEFSHYGKNWKAEKVYRKCIRNRKFNIADKIAKKYNLKIGNDDTAMAFSLALQASNHLRNKKTQDNE